MRRILWTLAICTVIGAGASLAISQDRNPFDDPSPFPSDSSHSRHTGSSRHDHGAFPQGRMSAGERPNYAELFQARDRDISSRRYSLNRTDHRADSANPFPESTSRTAGRSRTSERFGSSSSVSELPRQGTYRPVGYESTGTRQSQKDVIHAEYQRKPGERERIERIGLTRRETLHVPQQEQAAAVNNPLDKTVTERTEQRRSSRFTISRDTRLTDPVSVAPVSREPSWNFGNRREASHTAPAETQSRFVPSRSEPAFGTARADAGTITDRNKSRSRNAFTVSRPTKTASKASLPVAIRLQEKNSQSPSVTLEWVKKTGINVGQECTCQLVVRNSGIIPAEQIEVSATFPASVRLVATTPQPTSAEDVLRWEFSDLAPGEEQVIEIQMIPLEAGDLPTTAHVRFTGTAATKFTVSEPLLQVAVKGPEKVMVGDPASHTVIVTNPGTGVATNVQVEAIIPKGLEHARGERLIMDLGSLNPGETRSVRLALAAVAGGKQVLQVQARADGNLSRNTSASVDVIAPVLVAEVDGPKLRYLRRNATYTLRVRNDGVVTTENVRVMHKVPEGFTMVEADRGAQFDAPNNLLNWFVGRLGAGETAELKVTLRADKIGSFTQFVRATSEHGAISDAQVTTQVEGVSSLAMEIRDLDDPVEVGNETAYEIVVKNEGSAPARNVSLACEIPASLTLLKAHGPVESFTQPGGVSFRPVIELAPGNSVTYRVHVRGTTSGQHRIRARLSSDSISEPITEDELTRFYGE